jgi:hypothetical protein
MTLSASIKQQYFLFGTDNTAAISVANADGRPYRWPSAFSRASSPWSSA